MINYAPILGSSIPAFITAKIIVPFTHNPAVGKDEVGSFKLLIKDYNGNLKGEITKKIINNPTSPLTFNISTEIGQNLEAGQWYKIQLCYIDKANDIGPLSSTAVGRYIGDSPTLQLVSNNYIYTATYNSTIEPLYSYRYVLKNENQIILEDTGEILYNFNDNLTFDLSQYINGVYSLTFLVTTINGYTSSLTQKSINLTINEQNDNQGDLIELINKDNFVTVSIKQSPASDTDDIYLERKVVGDNKWVPILKVKSITDWKDFTVESGQNYIYGLKKYSTRTKSYITPYFEDMYLCDNEKNLKIQFNPQVSSFKTTVLEQKMDTIGSQYPFFFRNGHVNYKEFPISGLISYHMDENEEFMSKQDLGLDNTIKIPTTNLTDYNQVAERKFRLAVLDWLNNGKPKLFRSPTEGNYVVRLMNVSLTPEKTLGRLLYSFSATAYEISEENLDLLPDAANEYGISLSPLGKIIVGLNPKAGEQQ